MDISLSVLIVSRRREALDTVDAVLRKHAGLRVERKLVVNGHVDPLHGVEATPDVVILHLGETWQAELESLAARPVEQRPALIVVGSTSDTTVMRLAMQAGARDLLPLPLVEADLDAALVRIERDHVGAGAPREGNLIAFMNAKGGCGATLLACNVAHVLAAVSRKQVALLDLDLQFGAIPLYFDLLPKRGVLEALENTDDLDATALDAYMVKHASGLRILGQAAEEALSTAVTSPQRVRKLLDIAVAGHDQVVVDLPRRVDPVSTLVIERARYVVVAVQQSVAVLRDAKRLTNYLRHDLGLGKDRIVTVVNRYEKDAEISATDVRNTLGCGELSLIPNDYRTVSQSIDTGAPLFAHARGAAITKAVMALETRLGGTSATDRPNLIARTFSNLIKSRPA
jgi:pilus assembly protein CpaE